MKDKRAWKLDWLISLGEKLDKAKTHEEERWAILSPEIAKHVQAWCKKDEG